MLKIKYWKKKFQKKKSAFIFCEKKINLFGYQWSAVTVEAFDLSEDAFEKHNEILAKTQTNRPKFTSSTRFNSLRDWAVSLKFQKSICNFYFNCPLFEFDTTALHRILDIFILPM